ncbi:Similar to BTB/POZ domain protein [Talaromyces stipitatus ATCC 10500]; acc. no. XP_002488366 [Pyronema omphalodes CBS 100304]|uniref:Similar to BTB/POZ domain protein [Talaromyces stipitatus ATCC 10500] acc. no. XP_002488366 n=1 Tax=Pyronema omphalodes (strain CBS 100304) TaxID=1076935 RepID=U4L4V8_PYROM|nr:Similar to BTB/POZ domain protein [Talaromyces stipitatus ATCC 10500]; acc. no. XP_002488366 [Pyronema omphalodes CBS 100304]
MAQNGLNHLQVPPNNRGRARHSFHPGSNTGYFGPAQCTSCEEFAARRATLPPFFTGSYPLTIDEQVHEQHLKMAKERDKLAFLNEYEKIFNNPKHSDLTINCEDRTFYVHKIILSLRTQFFDNATDPYSNFVESNGVVTIQDHCADSVYCFLKWCYTGTYDITTLDIQEKHLLHIRVYAVADMFLCNALKTLAIRQLQKQMNFNWSAAEFPSIVAEVYEVAGPSSAAPDMLRKTVVMKKYGEFSAALVRINASKGTWEMINQFEMRSQGQMGEFGRRNGWYVGQAGRDM